MNVRQDGTAGSRVEDSPAYLRGIQRAVQDFKTSLLKFLELHQRNETFARGIMPAVFSVEDADPAEIARREAIVSRLAGRARAAPGLTGIYYAVQGAGKVDPIAAWHTMTQPKPALEPANVLAACDQMVGSLDDLIFKAELISGVLDPGGTDEPTWLSLNGRLEELVAKLGTARSLDDLQDVGRRCRDLLIAVGKLLADADLVPPGEDAPKSADAKAWLDLFLARHAAGSSLDDFRALIRASWKAAQGVTHGEVQRVEAYVATQVTVLIVRTLQQIADSA